ncbi:MAG: tyrosine-type recombinase/integrase [Chloroflexi bacterium]|nr:tyrosine-type recombinase/integrase [Chloroflexota bacterium]
MADFEQMMEVFHRIRHGSRPLPKLPPDEAVIALLGAAHNVKPQPKKPRLELARLRNIAMLEALRTTGMRVGELVKMKRDDLDPRNHAARVTGKGNKQRMVYFDDKAWQAIQEYLSARNDGERGRALYQLPVFARHDRRVSNKTLSLTTDTVRLVFNQLARDAQIEITMTPHSLRHAFATRVLGATGNPAVVQDMLGLSSPIPTRVYTNTSTAKQMRDVHRTAFGDRSKDIAQELAEIISKGENDLVEFKVAARWNPHTRKKDDSLKDNILQAVAAFMNRDGGTIIIGVNDKGVVVGLEEDYAAADPQKCNRDGYEMFLRNAISDRLGVDSVLYKVLFNQSNDKEVCQLKIEPASLPIYLDDDLYIRDGNKKRKLKVKDAISYIKEHWGDSP